MVNKVRYQRESRQRGLSSPPAKRSAHDCSAESPRCRSRCEYGTLSLTARPMAIAWNDCLDVRASWSGELLAGLALGESLSMNALSGATRPLVSICTSMVSGATNLRSTASTPAPAGDPRRFAPTPPPCVTAHRPVGIAVVTSPRVRHSQGRPGPDRSPGRSGR
jgi:hypothetical protein